MAARRALACVVLVTALVGCGTPSPGPGAATPAPDWPRLDPCSLLAPGALDRFGTAAPASAPNFDDCRVDLRNGVGELAVTLGSGGRLAQEHETEALGFELVDRGGYRVGRPRAVADSCGTAVVLPDLRYVTVDVSGEDAQLCAVTETAAESVRSVLRAGATRTRPYPANSLAGLDPCPLVPPELPARVPGIEARAPSGDGNRHVCLWGGRHADSPAVQVSFTVVDPESPPPTTIPVTAERIAGRDSLVRAQPASGGRLPSCRVDSRHIPFGAGTLENARVLIYSASPAEGSCPLAREVAAAVWARLPAP
ncbi:hypothetical protein JOF53_005688 [Crossiella equi]|uniref:DUF3558 domain-containing protein n=1 Tax=Crossiella equi TaxID=130796 RepID=A0ABS5AJS2_9PSEU|nr:hypothetical protein [Crossiella equi]MBP2476816.1 hypothetical protein [Crossiella equi]